MGPGRYLLAMAALLFGAIAVPAHAATIQITSTDLVFAPAEVSAKVGDTIEWINKDVFVHTATARNGRCTSAASPTIDQPIAQITCIGPMKLKSRLNHTSR